MLKADYLIWVGQKYYPSMGRFIDEAKSRGCCRKIPQLPHIAITGQTRIFLAHKDRLQGRENGRIFGYYVLGGIETIRGPEKSLRLPLHNLKNVKTPQGVVIKKEYWGDLPSEISTSGEEIGPLLKRCPECKEGEVKVKKCDDGKMITTHRCKDGYWERTREKCEESLDCPCEEGKIKLQLCDTGSVISHVCVNGEWQETGAECPKPYTAGQTMFETERECGFRLKSGSVYFVDALTSTINERFKQALEKEELAERYSRASSESDKQDLVARGRKLFAGTVDEVNKEYATRTKIPAELAGKAHLHGELVLFDKKPLYKKYPVAAFKGITRIDGDRLIKQISNGASEVQLVYPDTSWQWRLSQATKSSPAYVDRFLKALIEITKEELNSNMELKIPGLGKFYVIDTKQRYVWNFAKDEKILIPAKKHVRFRPFKNLKDFQALGCDKADE